jgi:hypothetical protein
MRVQTEWSLQQTAYAVAASIGAARASHMWPFNDGDFIQATSTPRADAVALGIITITANASARLDGLIPQAQSDWLKFRTYADDWKKNRASWFSFSGDLQRDPSYSKIIGMGPPAVKFILLELQAELAKGHVDNWFYALWAITKENPIPESAQGKPHAAARAWIEWGKREGLIDTTMGGALSAVG